MFARKSVLLSWFLIRSWVTTVNQQLHCSNTILDVLCMIWDQTALKNFMFCVVNIVFMLMKIRKLAFYGYALNCQIFKYNLLQEIDLSVSAYLSLAKIENQNEWVNVQAEFEVTVFKYKGELIHHKLLEKFNAFHYCEFDGAWIDSTELICSCWHWNCVVETKEK